MKTEFGGRKGMTTPFNLKNVFGVILLSFASAMAICNSTSAQSFSEDFSAGVRPVEFEVSGGGGMVCCGGQVGGPVFENGAVRFAGEDNRGDGSGFLRSYLRTIESDYSSVDFVAEVTVTVPNNPGRNVVFFGLGSADIDQSPGSGVANWQGIHLWVYPDSFAPGASSVDGIGENNTGPALERDLSCGGGGTHRLRLKWSACTETMVASIDQDYVGGTFSADCTFEPIDGSNNGFSDQNSRLYFGGDWNAIFDDFVVVTNGLPTADAGPDQSTRQGDTVLLDGEESFDDNTISAFLDYDWSFVTKPTGSAASLVDANTAFPEFVVDMAGTYTIQLVVTDENGACDTAYVEVSSDNLAPTALATVDFSLAIVGAEAQFDGSGSTDPEMDPLTYSWSIAAAPLGSTASLVDDGTDAPTLIPDLEGTYEVTLTASDLIGPGTPATVSIVATSATGFAENVIINACDIVETLAPEQVTTAGNQNAFCKHLANAVKDIQKGKIDHAIDTLNDAIERTDGFALRGSPDGNGQGRDWILDGDAQENVYDLLISAVIALEL